jgi:hypothetical protein
LSANQAAVTTLLRYRRLGVTLRRAAALAGVHVATVCRWQKRDPGLRHALAQAAAEWRDLRSLLPPPERPSVPWRKDCPLCRARVVVRTARGRARFWRCGRWPHCPWASWRPRAPRNCRHCAAPRYWSHSRQSVVCSGCGVRTRAP